MKTTNLISVLAAVLLLLSCETKQKQTPNNENKTEVVSQSTEHKQEVRKDDNYGIITKRSFVDVKTTMDRLEKIISKKEDVRLFNRINHAENSRNTGEKNVLDSELVIFGNPKVGLKMLSKDPRAGIDLPLKILAYKAKDGKVYVSYRDVSYFDKIYNLEGCEAKDKMSAAINKMSDIITKSPEDFKLFLEKSKS
ncbi:MAG TPA: hypothetical protein DDZ39_05060 [Flavobacteriaceae bacterium]|jgi:uncharacterized protein (DUF302 family)|nr:hypothetical protein [Flavobacteriaceae bacterium]HBS13168.1 hypothetical protein [Flavobacteriaceae bacterium]